MSLVWKETYVETQFSVGIIPALFTDRCDCQFCMAPNTSILQIDISHPMIALHYPIHLDRISEWE